MIAAADVAGAIRKVTGLRTSVSQSSLVAPVVLPTLSLLLKLALPPAWPLAKICNELIVRAEGPVESGCANRIGRRGAVTLEQG